MIIIISVTFTVFCSYDNDVECLHYNDNDDGIQDIRGLNLSYFYIQVISFITERKNSDKENLTIVLFI